MELTARRQSLLYSEIPRTRSRTTRGHSEARGLDRRQREAVGVGREALCSFTEKDWCGGMSRERMGWFGYRQWAKGSGGCPWLSGPWPWETGQ